MAAKEGAGLDVASTKSTADLFKAIDKNRDGKIDRQDFCYYYNKSLQKLHEDPRGQLYILQRLVDEVQTARQSKGPQQARGIKYSKGESIKLWSKSKQRWEDATVVAAYDADCFVDSYAVKSGTYKVETKSGKKWIPPEDVPNQMKKSNPLLMPVR